MKKIVFILISVIIVLSLAVGSVFAIGMMNDDETPEEVSEDNTTAHLDPDDGIITVWELENVENDLSSAEKMREFVIGLDQLLQINDYVEFDMPHIESVISDYEYIELRFLDKERLSSWFNVCQVESESGNILIDIEKSAEEDLKYVMLLTSLVVKCPQNIMETDFAYEGQNLNRYRMESYHVSFDYEQKGYDSIKRYRSAWELGEASIGENTFVIDYNRKAIRQLSTKDKIVSYVLGLENNDIE